MDRFAALLDAVNEVTNRCQDIVDDVKGKKKEETPLEGSLNSEEISDESLFTDNRALRKRVYVDDDLQQQLAHVRKEVLSLSDPKINVELTLFLDEYERLVEHERKLSNNHRNKELSELHSQMTDQSVLAEREVSVLDWDLITDEIGNPTLHHESEKCVQKLKDYISLEGKMVGISNKMKKAKTDILSHKKDREIQIEDIGRGFQAHQNRVPSSICEENMHKLSSENWETMSKDEQAVVLHKGLLDYEIVEKYYHAIKEKNAELNEEYKDLVKLISKKRTALLAHKGPKWAKEAQEKDHKEKELYRRNLEDYLKSMVTAIVNNDKLQLKLKNDRDQDLNQMRKLYAMLSGSPLSAVNTLEESLKMAGFDQYGRHNMKIGSSDQSAWEVMDRFQECVAETFAITSTALQREADLKLTTQLPPHRYIDRSDKIRKASKMPRADDVMEAIEQLEKFLLQNVKILKEFVDETNRFVHGDTMLARKIADSDKAMTFDIGRVNAVRYNLLHEQTLESVINATKVGLLAPVVSQPTIGEKAKKTKANKSGNKSIEPDSISQSPCVSSFDNTETDDSETEDTVIDITN